MLTLHFAGRELGSLIALQVSQEAASGRDVARWRATLEISAATPELVQQAVLTLESKLSGGGSLEVRHGANVLRTLAAGVCAEGPQLVRRSSAEGDDAEANPARIVTLEFEATLQAAPQAVPTDAGTFSESLSTSIRRRVVDLPLLAPNAPPWRQEIGAPAFEIIQEGEAASPLQHPQAGRPLYPADVIERRISYLSPAAAGSFVTRWRYVTSPLIFVDVKPQGQP